MSSTTSWTSSNQQKFTHNFSDFDIHEFKLAFSTLDTNRNGWIPTKKIGTILRNLGQNLAEDVIANLQNEVDPDREGEINFESFLKIMSIITRRDSQLEEEELKCAFRAFEKTPDGCIDAEEFRYVMTHLGEKVTDEDVDEMLAAIDEDGDGKITFEEFKDKMMGYKKPLDFETSSSYYNQ